MVKHKEFCLSSGIKETEVTGLSEEGQHMYCQSSCKIYTFVLVTLTKSVYI